MDITPADATMRDLDIDVRLGPLLRLKRLPLHGSFYGVFVEAEPAMKFCRGGHIGALECGTGEYMDWDGLRW
jgi:hypothetical protein